MKSILSVDQRTSSANRLRRCRRAFCIIASLASNWSRLRLAGKLAAPLAKQAAFISTRSPVLERLRCCQRYGWASGGNDPQEIMVKAHLLWEQSR